MKKIYALILCFTCFYSFGQNYNCFQPGTKNFFINSDHYLRGIRIDSVTTATDTTIYYPYHSKRYFGSVVDSVSGSWLGKKVMGLSDGTFLFDTHWGYAITIKTLALPGDSWTFYHDAGTQHYDATLLSMDTMTVLGSMDSIKLIHIAAYNGTAVDLTDSINGREIILSKDHGFVQTFDLYTFPYHPGTNDFYTACGHQVFKLINFTTPTQSSIYDFNPGDCFEFYTDEQTIAFVETQTTSIDSVTSKSTVGGSTHYTINHKSNGLVIGTGGLTGTSKENYTSEIDVTSTPIIADTLMPEEKGFPYMVHYIPDDNGCITSPKYVYEPYIPFPFEDCTFRETYKQGIGEILLDSCLTSEYHNSKHMNLLYANKGGIACGYYNPLTVEGLSFATPCVAISPNPATSVINISYFEKIASLTICNIWGKQVLTQKESAKDININIEDLPAGIYFLKVNNQAISKFVKQ